MHLACCLFFLTYHKAAGNYLNLAIYSLTLATFSDSIQFTTDKHQTDGQINNAICR